MINNKITIQANVAAVRKKVWEYYTTPEHITQWNFATDDWTCPTASNDLRVGGKYSARMEAKDGSFGFDFEGIYEEFSDHENYTFIMTDGRKVKVSFDEKGGNTDVVITFDAETQNPVDMQRDGWQAILNNFKKYVENN